MISFYLCIWCSSRRGIGNGDFRGSLTLAHVGLGVREDPVLSQRARFHVSLKRCVGQRARRALFMTSTNEYAAKVAWFVVNSRINELAIEFNIYFFNSRFVIFH